MCRQIHAAANDLLVRRAAADALQRFRTCPAEWIGSDFDCVYPSAGFVAESCFWWCKHFLKFRHHGSMFELWRGDLGDPGNKLQLLIAPDVLVRMERMEGDCAIYTMMLCAMLEALGLDWQIVTAAVDPSQPTIFSHVWARSGGQSLDASHGEQPGWQVPARDIFRMWTFDNAGRRVSEGGGRFNGLHAYRGRGMGQDDVSQYLTPEALAAGEAFWDQTSGQTAYQAPAQNSAQWATFASNLAKMGFDLARINAIQPGTVVSSSGAILRQSEGYAVGTPTVAANLGISTTTLVVGGIALLAVVFLFSGRGR